MKDLALQVIEAEIAYHKQRIEELEKKKRDLEKALASPEVKAKLVISPADLEKLPWKNYPNGKGSWIFADLQDPIAKTLVELLEEHSGKIKIGGFVYRFSGPNKKFVSRYPRR